MIALNDYLTAQSSALGLSVDDLLAQYDYRPCDCGQESCEGWCLVPDGALKNFSEHERAVISGAFRLAWLADASTEEYVGLLEAARIANNAKIEEMMVRFTCSLTAALWQLYDEWDQLAEFVALKLGRSEEVPQFVVDLIAFVERNQEAHVEQAQ